MRESNIRSAQRSLCSESAVLSGAVAAEKEAASFGIVPSTSALAGTLVSEGGLDVPIVAVVGAKVFPAPVSVPTVEVDIVTPVVDGASSAAVLLVSTATPERSPPAGTSAVTAASMSGSAVALPFASGKEVGLVADSDDPRTEGSLRAEGSVATLLRYARMTFW